VSKITLIGYQGTGGFRSPRYAREPGLIKAGHVGIQCDGDDRIFGFHPTAAAVEAAGGLEALIEQLQNHVAQPGAVFDDTAVFVRAHELAEQGERTTVWHWEIDVSEDEAARICQMLVSAYETQQAFVYNFPRRDGSFEAGQANCATFPAQMGLPLPSPNGNLSIYVPAMIEQGATQWTPSK